MAIAANAAPGPVARRRRDQFRTLRQLLHPATRAGLIEIARGLDPVVLRWGR
jgi:4-hydroxy-tetrahydrodipicolinate synthase